MPEENRWVDRWWVVPLRLFLAVLWLYAAAGKLNPEFGGVRRIVEVMALGEPSSPHGNPIEWYRRFLLDVVLPHWRVFGALIAAGEMAVGISLALGLATRLGAAVGVGLFIMYALGRAYLEWPFTYPVLIVAQIMIIWTAAGRTFGIDAWLSKRWPKGWPIW